MGCGAINEPLPSLYAKEAIGLKRELDSSRHF
jgi:hypothetical protein